MVIPGDKGHPEFALICPVEASLIVWCWYELFQAWGCVMLVRGVGALAIILSLTPGARAGGHSGIVNRVSCTVVRYYVAKYSASAAEIWARGHGATDAEIEAARHCLNDMPAQTAHWTAR